MPGMAGGAVGQVGVSILVPLDHLPRPDRSAPLHARDLGFNPCSAGSPSPTSDTPRRAGRTPIVSILVPLDHLPRPPRDAAEPSSGFNPCSAGSPSPTRGTDSEADRTARVSILVPLDHLPRHRMGLFAMDGWGKSFNPCSAGSPSPTAQVRCAACFNAQFQSLFRWITFPNTGGGRLKRQSSGVSILVPLDHLPRHPLTPVIQKGIEVSILVPLDHLPRHPEAQGMGPEDRRFQSLFRWITFPDASSERS